MDWRHLDICNLRQRGSIDDDSTTSAFTEPYFEAMVYRCVPKR
jgi:hypothetical protein